MRYILGIFFLCLTTFSGCAADTVTVTSSGTTTTTTSATVAPTSTSVAGLNAIDWLNTTYPDLCQMNGGARVTVVNGLGPLSSNGVRLHVFDPIFSYITRTSQLDAVIPYGCIGHMDSGTSILVYSGDASNPTSVGQLPLAASKYSLASVFTEGILAHKLELSGIGFSSDAIPQCCPDVWVTDTYTWNSSAFTLSAHDATKLGQQLAP